MFYLRLVTTLTACTFPALILGGWWAMDRGIHPAIGVVAGAVLGMLAGLVLGGYLRGRWLDVLFPK